MDTKCYPKLVKEGEPWKEENIKNILTPMTRQERARALLAVARRWGELVALGKIKKTRDGHCRKPVWKILTKTRKPAKAKLPR